MHIEVKENVSKGKQSNLFDMDKYQDIFLKASIELNSDIFNHFANQAYQDILPKKSYTNKDYDPNLERIARFINEKSFRFAQALSKNTEDMLRGELVDAYMHGEDIDQIMRRVGEVFKISGTGYRAERIARTETVGSANAGAMEGYKQTGRVKQKQWIATRDSKTRPAHASANGTRVNIDDPFMVDGDELQHPGDPNGSPANIIKCRCCIGPVVARDMPDYKPPVAEPEKPDITQVDRMVEVETLGEASYLARKLLNMSKIEYDGMDIRLANQVNFKTEEIFDKIPQLKGVMRGILTDPSINRNVYAQARGNIQVEINPLMFDDLDYLEKSYARDLKAKWHPEDTKAISIFTHEMGHILDVTLSRKLNMSPYEFSKKCKRSVMAKLKLKTSDLQDELSGYGMTKHYEFFAEAFCEWMDSPNPRPVAKAVGEYIMKTLKEMEK